MAGRAAIRATVLAGSIATAAVLLAPPPLAAHDLWIAPSSFTPVLDEPLRLHLVLGDGRTDDRGGVEAGGPGGFATLEAVPRDDASIVRFVASGPRGVEAVRGLAGLDPAGFLRPTESGWYTILYESSPTFARLDADTFRAYLLEKRLRPAPDAALAASTTELFRRSLKARILVVARGAGLPPADPGEESPAGLPLELVMERVLPVEADAPATVAARACTPSAPSVAAAFSAPAGSSHRVALRLLLDGEPLAGAQVDLRRLDQHGIVTSASTDGEGRLELVLNAGRWLATTVHLDASRPGRADWESVWASLTFELR